MNAPILTESELSEGLHKRRPVFPDFLVDQPVTFQEVDAQFRAARRNRADIGITNHILNLFLEPRNPFEPQRMRKPKMEAVVFGTLLALVVIAVLAFNLTAPRPY
jgi:hypothetical protein